MEKLDGLKEAYETMGLEQLAPKEEVEKRYTTLMRRERSRSKLQQDESASPEGEDFAKITEAYKLILAHEDRKVTDAFNEQEYGKYKGMAGQAQKMDHFWRYYKIHTFVAIALIAVIIYGINSYIDKREHEKYLASLPPIDLNISFFGTFVEPDGQDDKDALNASMLGAFPDWKRLQSNIVFVPQDDMNQYAYLQKAVVTLMSEKPDIYIMDRAMFEWVGSQGVLMSLDGKPEFEGVDASRTLKLTTEEQPEERVYGIDLKDSKLDKDLPLMKQDLIVGVRVNAEHPEKALQFIETYLKTLQQ
ncbi:J domain-containing protein [Paenibacillus sp. LHD-117]|uniref:J domain-containing protein n=1 Tax=Paenibacillus sp. LHD-117 TaxID=3071412 RepID=UPI0027E0C9CB|nr:J domain-containing protein [Paenibacillus sp. LHD-117]MDQ6421811.1 J domain-containing protein [Paenibacillus sp. LHD-117]